MADRVNNDPGDVQVHRNIVVEALAAPKYSLDRLEPEALRRFEDAYEKYRRSAMADPGAVITLRSKVQCFNDKLLRYLAMFKIDGRTVDDYADITEFEIQRVIDRALSAERIQRADRRDFADIAKSVLKWDQSIHATDQRVEKLGVSFTELLVNYHMSDFFRLEGNH